VLVTRYYLGDQIKENEIGGAGSMYGGEERCRHRFWLGNLRKRHHLDDTGINGIIILK
jgi:hypothetical protein